MKTRAFLVHALSPLHAGIGHADDVVDLPTARLKASGLPFVPGSSIKGVLRAAATARSDVPRDERAKDWSVLATFGPLTAEASAHAGALIVGDARLLALPVRSFCGTFAWVSSPLLLALARRDLAAGGLDVPRPPPAGKAARWALCTQGSVCVYERTLYLEDLDLPASHAPEVDAWAAFLTPYVAPGDEAAEGIFAKRFAVIDDDIMSFLCETALQIDARVRLNPETRTVEAGALWLEESLPPETLLLGLLAADRTRRSEGVEMPPERVLDFALAPGGTTLQLGGHATIGRGRCRVTPLAKVEEAPQ
ncbi:MAG: type III-B CRISPR module RAMP protein Cmr4 [Polyangiaceae bacterium]|nr:type III-B CRISPR module RAMP protein Cmr4 [Polyangiaceae bacterium]